MPAAAQTGAADTGTGLYLQYGRAGGTTRTATVGALLPWDWRTEWAGGAVTGYWDLSLSHWRIEGAADDHALTQIGFVPTVRYRFATGRSGWFLDAGTGPTLTDSLYRPRGKDFSTRFNFATHLGVGYTFGTERRHELALRYQHVSNAGIKKPNPGEDFGQVRYSYRF